MKKLSFLTAAFAISVSLFATTASAGVFSQCFMLNVHIVNGTGDACYLTSGTMPTNGYYAPGSDIPPTVLKKNKSSDFTLVQRFLVSPGPNITLSYDCSGKSVTIRSQQTRCGVYAGTVTPAIVSKDPALNVTFSTQEPSRFWGTPGRLFWTFR